MVHRQNSINTIKSIQMKNLFLLITGAACLLFASCNGCSSGNASNDEPQKDTVVIYQPVVMNITVISDKLADRHAKVSGTHENTHTEHHGRNVRIDADPSLLHHEHEETAEAVQEGGYYFKAPHWAEFPGGESALDEYLQHNLAYPKEAADAHVEGVVYAALFVDEMGQIEDVKFPAKQMGYGLEEEVERLVKGMPNWNPGAHEGTTVKSKFILPIRFEIQDNI